MGWVSLNWEDIEIVDNHLDDKERTILGHQKNLGKPDEASYLDYLKTGKGKILRSDKVGEPKKVSEIKTFIVEKIITFINSLQQ